MQPLDPITEDDLNAYVDGGLDMRRRAEVERWLAQHPHDAARVMADMSLTDMLRMGLVDAGFLQPSPPRTLSLAGQLRRRLLLRGTVHIVQRAAMVVLLVASGYGLNWLPLGPMPKAEAAHVVPVFADEAAEAFRTAMREGLPERAPAYPDAVVPARLAAFDPDKPLAVPPPPTRRWHVSGAQLIPWDNGDAVQVFWKHETKGTAVLFVAQVPAAPAQRISTPTTGHTEEGDVVYWQADGFVYALLGTSDTKTLERLAHLLVTPAVPDSRP